MPDSSPNLRSSSQDSLLSELRELRPAGTELDGRAIFFEAGFRAAEAAQTHTLTRRFRWLASLLLVATGALPVAFFVGRASSEGTKPRVAERVVRGRAPGLAPMPPQERRKEQQDAAPPADVSPKPSRSQRPLGTMPRSADTSPTDRNSLWPLLVRVPNQPLFASQRATGLAAFHHSALKARSHTVTDSQWLDTVVRKESARLVQSTRPAVEANLEPQTPLRAFTEGSSSVRLMLER